MSSPMGPGGSPPGGMGGSVFNPNDMAIKKAIGQVNPNMTVGQWLAQMGISPDDPIQAALQKLKGQVQGASPDGKMQQMAGQMGGQAPPTAGAPQPSSLQDEIRPY